MNKGVCHPTFDPPPILLLSISAYHIPFLQSRGSFSDPESQIHPDARAPSRWQMPQDAVTQRVTQTDTHCVKHCRDKIKSSKCKVANYTTVHKAYLVASLVHISSCVVVHSQHWNQTIGCSVGLNKTNEIQLSSGYMALLFTPCKMHYNSKTISVKDNV